MVVILTVLQLQRCKSYDAYSASVSYLRWPYLFSEIHCYSGEFRVSDSFSILISAKEVFLVVFADILFANK